MNWSLEQEVWGNSLVAWGSAIGVTLIGVITIAIARWVLVNRLIALNRHTRGDLFESLAHALRGTRLWLLFFPVLKVGIQALELPERVFSGVGSIATVAFFVQVGIWATRILHYWINHSKVRALQTNAGAATSLGAVSFIGQLVLWSVLLLVMLQNIGVNITALVAGLGVGGIAVALAVQNVLGDVFASLSIIIDKPFVIDDFVVVGEYAGTIEYVGLKTTRIRSLSGEQLVFSNSDLLSTRVRNYKRMQTRRIVFEFGVTYQTPHDKLARIGGMVREIIEGIEQVKFDRGHFKAFGDSSYDFEVVYIVQAPEFNLYMDIQERINLGLVERFAAEGIEFAFPSRTLYIPEGIVLQRAPKPADAPAAASPAARTAAHGASDSA